MLIHAVQTSDLKLQPTTDQLNLMKRTAAALQGAENPALLEMKILANHGGDPRFSFLRKGKEQQWVELWGRLRNGENVGKRKVEVKEKNSTLNLVDYGSSSDVEEDNEEELLQAKKKRRLQLAREWSAKRSSKS